jgi:hypothetical protein
MRSLAYAYESGMNYGCIIHALGTNKCEAFKTYFRVMEWKQEVCHIVALPFTLKYLKAKEELWTLK